MGKSQLAVRIPHFLHDKLNSYVERTGTSNTEAVVVALAQYLGCVEEVPLSQKMAEMERKLRELEAKVNSDFEN